MNSLIGYFFGLSFLYFLVFSKTPVLPPFNVWLNTDPIYDGLLPPIDVLGRWSDPENLLLTFLD